MDFTYLKNLKETIRNLDPCDDDNDLKMEEFEIAIYNYAKIDSENALIEFLEILGDQKVCLEDNILFYVYSNYEGSLRYLVTYFAKEIGIEKFTELFIKLIVKNISFTKPIIGNLIFISLPDDKYSFLENFIQKKGQFEEVKLEVIELFESYKICYVEDEFLNEQEAEYNRRNYTFLNDLILKLK